MSQHSPEEIAAAEALLAEVLAKDVADAQAEREAPRASEVPSEQELLARIAAEDKPVAVYHEHGRMGSDSGERV